MPRSTARKKKKRKEKGTNSPTAYTLNKNNQIKGTSLVVQLLGLHLPMQGVRVWFLVGELRPHMPHGQKNKIKQKQYGNKFNKDFKNVPHQKQIFKKKPNKIKTYSKISAKSVWVL